MKNHLPASKRITALLCSLFLFAAVFVSKVSAQVDTVFWFAVPYVNVHHGLNTPNYTNTNPADNFIGGGRPIYLKVSTLAQPATVTVSVPAKNYTIYSLTIPANSTQTFDLSKYADSIVVSKKGNVIENKGLLVHSTALVTAYYENATIQNPDLFSLKGSNALGTEFYTPFQTLWPNDPRHNANWDDPIERYYNAWFKFYGETDAQGKAYPKQNREGFVYTPLDWPPYNPITYPDSVLKADSAFTAFDIVATEDNTSITITPTTDIVGHAKNIPFTITLHRGQTYSARAVTQGVLRIEEGHNKTTWRATTSYNPSDTVNIIVDNKDIDNLSGSHVVASKKIAVTIKDDSVSPNDEPGTYSGGSEDFNGDQIVPVDLIGSEYLVMRGNLDPSKTKEHIFIVAVQDGTVITAGDSTYTLNKGQTKAHPLCTGSATSSCHDYVHVISKNGEPFYVYHISGYNAESAGAILPPISECTGSSQIGFTRTYGGLNSPDNDTRPQERFFMNLLVRSEGAVDKSAFEVYTNGVIDWSATNVIRNATFTPIGSSPWSFLRVEFNESQLANGAHLLKNNKELFHMAFVNSTAYKWGTSPASLTGALYGYFSKFNKAVPDATVFLPKTKFNDTVYVNPGQPFSFIADGGVAYSWSAEKYDSTSTATNKWTPIDASKILTSLTDYNPSSKGIATEGAYRFPVKITNSCYVNPADTLYVIVANFIPPYQITDTVCDIAEDPAVYLSQYYDLNHLNDTIVRAKADSAGYKITGWYETVSGGSVDLEDFDGTSLLGAGIATNGTIANAVNTDKTGNPSATAAHLVKTSNTGNDIAQKRTVSVVYPFDDAVDLSEGYKFSFLFKYDGSALAAPSNKTNNKIFVELISPNKIVKSVEMTIADAAMTTPQWMQQQFSFAKDSTLSGFTQMRISVVSTFDHTVDYGFYIDDVKRDVLNHYKKIENDTKYTFNKYYNTIIAKYEGSGRSVMDTNYVYVMPTGRATHNIRQPSTCRLETDSLCGIDLSQYKYSIGGALVGAKWWYRSIIETADTVIYKDSIANITNVCVMGEDTLYAHVQDKCYKYGSLIYDVVPTPVYTTIDKTQTITLCGDQSLGGKNAYADLKSYEALYFKNTTYKWDVTWYKSATMTASNKITDPSRAIVANSDILYGEVNASGKTLCPEQITLKVVVKEKPAITFSDQAYCEDITAQAFNVTPTGGSFTVNKVAVTDFNPALYAGPTVDVVYAITSQSCPWLDTAKFTVHKAPVASIAPKDTLQYGFDLHLDATVTNGSDDYEYTWSNEKASVNKIVDPKVQDVSVTQMFDKDSFSLVVVDRVTGCNDTAHVIVNVKGIPLKIEIVPSAAPLCATRSQYLNAIITGGVGPYSLKWSEPNNDRTSSMKLLDSILISPAVTTTYSVTVTDHGDRDKVKETFAVVTVYQNPVINAEIVAKGATVCQNSPLTLNGSATGGTGALDYKWSGADAALLTTPTMSNPVFDSKTAPKTYTFRYIVTDEKSCSDTADIKVNVLTLPTLGINKDQAVCSGHDLTLDAATTSGTTPYTYLWTGDVANLNFADKGLVVFNKQTAVAATSLLKVKVTDNNACADSLNITVAVNPLPVPNITGDEKGVCKNAIIKVTAEPVGAAYSYIWKSAKTQLGTAQALDFDLTTAAAAVPLNLIVTDGATGCSDSVLSSVTVHELPTLSISNAGANKVCVNADLQLEALASSTPAGALQYSWTPVANITPADARIVQFKSSVVSTIPISVTVTDERNCQSTASDVVSVLGRPIYTKPAVSTICTQLDYDFDLQIASGNTVTWSGDLSVLKNNPAGAKPRFYATEAGIFTVNYEVSDGFCTSSDAVTLNVNLRPDVSVANYEACESVTHSIEALLTPKTQPLTVAYAWTENTQVLASVTNMLSYKSSVQGQHNLQVIASANNGCSDTAVFVVNVNENPTVSIVANSGQRVPYNMDLNLSARAIGGTPGYVYTWESSEPIAPTELNATEITRTKFNSVTSISYTLNVLDSKQCPGSATRTFYTVDPTTTTYNVDCNKDTIPQNAPQYVVPSCPECDTIKNVTDRNKCKVQNVYSHNFEICEGLDVLLSPVNSDFGDPASLQYTWYVDGVKMNWTEKNKVFVPSAVSRKPLAKGDTLTVLVEITNGFMDAPVTDEITIIVNPNPVPVLSVATVGGVDDVLKEFYFTNEVPSATKDDVLKYKWSGDLSDGVDTALLRNDSLKYVVPAVINTTNPTIVLGVQDNHGCKGSASYGVNQLRVDASCICENNIATYYIYGLPKNAQLHFINEPQAWTKVTDTIYTAFWPQGGSFPFTVTASDSDPKVLIVGDTVTQCVISYPEVNIVGLADVCVGQTKPYEVETSQTGTTSWSLGKIYESTNKLISTDSIYGKSVDATWNRVGLDTLSVVVNNAGCSGSDYMFVNTHANPISDFKYAPVNDILIGTEVTFTNNSLGEKTDSDLSFYWDFVGEGVFTSEQSSPTYKYQDMGTYPVHLITYDNTWGCIDTAIVNVTVLPNPDCSMDYPNTMITSHTNPKARVFYSFNRVGVLEEGYTLKIFNQWGAMVWETNDINAQWDGYYNGSLVAQAVYVFQSEATCENGKLLKQNGDVTVLR